MGARTIHLATVLGLLVLSGCAGASGGNTAMSIDALEGKTWVLAQLDEGSPAPDKPAITAVFETGKVSGSGGCNQYTASVASPSPGAIQVGPVSASKRFCMDPVGGNEQRFFAALAKARRYTLEEGRLVLHWENKEQAPGKLVFTLRSAAR
jgi:heat shock protein HslJ